MSAAASGGVFISYRRQETSGLAGRLYDRLADRFGDDQVFMDVDTIALGVDFAEVITQAVSTCQVLLAVIGPRWLTATDEGGQRRLDDPDDIVRLEIAAALERDIRVIPILVEGAVMPRRQELPDTLARLARRNALSLRHESFRADADRLLAAIEPILRPPAAAAPVSSIPARADASPPRATEPEPSATASKAETTIPTSAPLATGWSSTQVRTFEHPSKWGLLGSRTVLGVAFSPDGRWLATGSDDKTARIWDAHIGQQRHTLRHDDRVRAVAFSPDGRLLATASDDKTARIWDAHIGQRLHLLSHDGQVGAVAFSPDGRLLATSSIDWAARLWDAGSGQLLHTLRHDERVWAVAFSPDGRWLATSSADKTARLWDAGRGQLLHTLSDDGPVRAVAFSPDGRWLATGSDNNGARIWSADRGLLHILSHGDWVRAVAFSPDGRWLATGSADKRARLWDADSGQLLHTLRHDDWVRAVAFSPDGRLLATGTGGNRAMLWLLTPSYQ